ncbi:putative ORFan [Tupanvirus deep ocean]|uniref:ORFan n=2 Tax=Tupanvirus TaxID=2094720 RepID=A0AC62A796_9VIRU|nr:putative ORFan [Tupanvirus deep ocean]QKU33606.1 putative ORFan [Tupanvirus deep ocean]
MQINVVSYNIEGLTLETNYCNDQSLKNYIINKSKYLNEYLKNIHADIICIQEYTPILNIKIDDFHNVIEGSNAIFYRANKFSYVKHIFKNSYGLLVTLNMNDLIIKVCTHRLPPFNENSELRKNIIQKIDKISKNKIFIFAADTNMRKWEVVVTNNLTDCFDSALITNGFYTLDKKFNPYFEDDNKKTNRNRYDKIYCTDFFDCEQLVVCKPKPHPSLVHPIYPYANVSDHYPILAVLTII